MNILCDRGTVFYWKPENLKQKKDSKGKEEPQKELYKIKGLTGTPGIIVASVVREENDAVAPASTLDGEHLLYVFGKAIGNVTITGLILLGKFKGKASGFSKPGKKTGHDLLGVLHDWFNKKRVSKLEDSVEISIAGYGAYDCFLTSLRIGAPNPAVQTMPFVITGIAGDDSSGGGDSGGGD